jgi:DNA polymerase-3 subunit epsilon
MFLLAAIAVGVLVGAAILISLFVKAQSIQKSRKAGGLKEDRPSVANLPTGRPPFITGPLKGIAFEYPNLVGWNQRLDTEYVVLDFETTGLSPRTDRIIEVAATRIDSGGTVIAQFSTLINPQRTDTGAMWIHRIGPRAVKHAPLFSEVYETLSDFLSGAVVVAHNAPFEEWFLAAECSRFGLSMPRFHALDSCWLSRQIYPSLPNHRLITVASACGLKYDQHTAAGDVGAVVSLLPMLLKRGPQLAWRESVRRFSHIPKVNCRTRPRAIDLQRGDTGWMSNLMAALPEIGQADALSARYAEALALAMVDGKIVGEEARELAHLAADEGLSAKSIREIHAEFLEGMRTASMADQVITAAELKALRGAAKALGLPLFFDDLTATPRSKAASVSAETPRSAVRQFRCGICGEIGHNRRSCVVEAGRV